MVSKTCTALNCKNKSDDQHTFNIKELIYFLHVIHCDSCVLLCMFLSFSFIRLAACQKFFCQNALKEKKGVKCLLCNAESTPL